jgi:hypothetical protein
MPEGAMEDAMHVTHGAWRKSALLAVLAETPPLAQKLGVEFSEGRLRKEFFALERSVKACFSLLTLRPAVSFCGFIEPFLTSGVTLSQARPSCGARPASAGVRDAASSPLLLHSASAADRVGAARAVFSDRPWPSAGIEMLVLGSIASAVAFAVGCAASVIIS